MFATLQSVMEHLQDNVRLREQAVAQNMKLHSQMEVAQVG
jgi:hypothetical protein